MFIDIVIVLLTAYIAIVLVAWAYVGAARGVPLAWQAIVSPFQWMTDTSARRSGREHLEQELAARLQHGTRADEHLLVAANATMQIQVAHLWLKESTATCLDTHWALAKGLAVDHMSEAAWHPRSVTQRHQNLELAEFLADIIQGYPYPTPELIQLEVAVPRVAATCAACPYFFVTRADAPRVCPPAGALGYQARSAGHGQPAIVDAEPIHDEDLGR
jgi:hypothetical protein